MVSLEKLKKSFQFAFKGLKCAWQQEQSFRIQLIIAFVVIGAAVYFHITRLQALVLGLTILMVLSFELVNTMSERIIDLVEWRWKQEVGEIKDVLAGAVLVASLGAIIIGIIIFFPYIKAMFFK